jgi:DNA processing protein
VGPKTFQKILKLGLDLPLDSSALLGRPEGVSAKLWNALLDYSLEKGAALIEASHKKGMTVVAWGDPAYPPMLAQSGYAPPVFWLKGRLPEPALPSLAMVGTRTPSPHAREVCNALLAGMARTHIVSGLANGVDFLSHAAALRSGFPTTAVLAQGLDTPIDGARGGLAQLILDAGGALLSIFPPGSPVSKSCLVERNRVIAGLAEATLLVESRKEGGAMHTAKFCVEEGRPLYAIPGDPWRETAQGGNSLIEKGLAKPMWSLGMGEMKKGVCDTPPLTLEEFAKKRQKTIPEILPLLTEWELEGKVRVKDGYWVELLNLPS